MSSGLRVSFVVSARALLAVAAAFGLVYQGYSVAWGWGMITLAVVATILLTQIGVAALACLFLRGIPLRMEWGRDTFGAMVISSPSEYSLGTSQVARASPLQAFVYLQSLRFWFCTLVGGILGIILGGLLADADGYQPDGLETWNNVGPLSLFLSGAVGTPIVWVLSRLAPPPRTEDRGLFFVKRMQLETTTPADEVADSTAEGHTARVVLRTRFLLALLTFVMVAGLLAVVSHLHVESDRMNQEINRKRKEIEQLWKSPGRGFVEHPDVAVAPLEEELREANGRKALISAVCIGGALFLPIVLQAFGAAIAGSRLVGRMMRIDWKLHLGSAVSPNSVTRSYQTSTWKGPATPGMVLYYFVERACFLTLLAASLAFAVGIFLPGLRAGEESVGGYAIVAVIGGIFFGLFALIVWMVGSFVTKRHYHLAPPSKAHFIDHMQFADSSAETST